jgi:hypothetical protein
MPIASEPELHIGQSIGDGHCVALVRYAADMDHTSVWRRGVRVLDAAVPRWTVIATFDDEGRYVNATDGSSHAAIFLEETPRGSIRVIDQWVGKRVSERVIRDKGGKGPAVDDASQYYVVEVA